MCRKISDEKKTTTGVNTEQFTGKLKETSRAQLTFLFDLLSFLSNNRQVKCKNIFKDVISVHMS